MDTISNMLTTIRNAQLAKHDSIKAVYSRVNLGIAEVLKKEGWIQNAEVKKRGEKGWIIIELKYDKEGMPVITYIQKVSKLGKRIYKSYRDIPIINQGRGLAIVSTPKGIMTGKEARTQKVGGEVLCKLY